MRKIIIKILMILAVTIGLNSLANAVTSSESEKVMLKQNFQNVDIRVVIEAISKLTGKNYIIDQRVKGKVTLIAPEPMSADSLNEILLSILRVHGYIAIPGEDAISIIPANLARDRIPFNSNKPTAKDNWVTEVIRIKHISAAKLVAVLRPIVAREGHLVALQESNNLIVTDSIKNIGRIKKIVSKVDVNTAEGYEIVKVRYGSAEEMVKTIKSIMHKPVSGQAIKINFDERSNNIVLSGDSKIRKGIIALIHKLDVVVESAGRVQVVYLRYAKAEDLVPVLQKISTNRSLLNSVDASNPSIKPVNGRNKVTQLDSKTLKDSISIEADERMNAVVISAPPQILTALKGVIKQLDIRRAQVLIEAVFVEISEDKKAQLGIEWAVNGPNGVGMIDFSGTIPALIGAAVSPTTNVAGAISSLGQGTSILAGQFSSDNTGWGALIRALNSDTGSNVLATPSIMTLDNEEAEIVVGREVPFTTGSYTSGNTGGTNPFSTVERKNVGLKLKVKPQINEGNEVFLEIDQEVSDVLPKGDAVDLQTSKRQIKTKVIVGDGNVIVLGGLLTEKETEVISKVPLLGDIPLLGALFTSRQSKREKVNLMVFLRPIIIRDNLMSNYYSRKKYSAIRDYQQQILEKDIGLLEGLRPRLKPLKQWKKEGKPQKKSSPKKVNKISDDDLSDLVE
jgi:general secretion pathway protein D